MNLIHKKLVFIALTTAVSTSPLTLTTFSAFADDSAVQKSAAEEHTHVRKNPFTGSTTITTDSESSVQETNGVKYKVKSKHKKKFNKAGDKVQEEVNTTIKEN